MEGFPEALIIASRESVFHNNNVLYRLVKPLADGSGVESVDRLVNVVPFRRTYYFERKHEIENFRDEILKRPLVLQPVLHFGRGLGPCCGAFYQDEPWIVMINQTHPKVLSRLQMGLDSAKTAIERGQACDIKFRFSKLIQRVYREHLAQKELGEAQAAGSKWKECLTNFRYVEWEFCDLVIRYHGYAAKLNRTTVFDLQVLAATFDFEDIGMHEMVWSQLHEQEFPIPHLAPVYEDEIRERLPAWTINGVSPLEEIGDSIPEHNYSYAQAGRLYQSFRKKNRQRNRPQQDGNPAPGTYTMDDAGYTPELEGAVGYDPGVEQMYGAEASYDSIDCEAVEHDFGHNKPKPPSRSKHRYQDPEVSHYDDEEDYHDRVKPYSNYDDYKPKTTENNSEQLPTSGSGQPEHDPEFPVAASRPDKYGHMHANVEIKSSASSKYGHMPANVEIKSSAPSMKKETNGQAKWQETSYYDSLEPSSSDYHHYASAFKKQDSDRSSRSTNADSGYCPDEIDRSRGDSYDYNDQTYMSKYKQGRHGYDSHPLKGTTEIQEGLENLAFRYDDHEVDFAMKRHKEFNVRQDHPGKQHIKSPRSPTATSLKGTVQEVRKAPPRQKKVLLESINAKPVAESYI